MKTMFSFYFVFLLGFICCKKQDNLLGDYLPLNVDKTFLFVYQDFYREHYEGYPFINRFRKGECRWDFQKLERFDTITIYTVLETFKGFDFIKTRYNNSPSVLDSIKVENDTALVYIKENRSGGVTINFYKENLYFKLASIQLNRYYNSNKNDTCFDLGYVYFCQRLGEGLTEFGSDCHCNHAQWFNYQLLE